MTFKQLLISKNFAPLFWTQFLGALNDNLYKNALVILLTINVTQYSQLPIELLVPLSGGLFILPFFLFSALAGQLADKYEKSQLIQWVKKAEIAIMLLATLGFYLQNIWLLLMVLFLMGCQSSLFGPVKYSILPQHLSENGLLKGNAMIEMGTFLAILLGTIIGGVVAAFDPMGPYYISILVVIVAFVGWLSSRKIPLAKSANDHLTINFNIFSQTWTILKLVRKNALILAAIMAISWFWFIGATILSILPLPGFIEQVLSSQKEVITLLLALFSIGIGIGSMISGQAKNLEKSLKWVAIGGVLMTIILLDLYWACEQLINFHQLQEQTVLASWQSMFTQWHSIHVIAGILLLGLSGGLYIVPLYVILQEHSELKVRSQIISGNNIINALFMVISALITMWALDSGLKVHQIFILMSGLNGAVLILLYALFVKQIKTLIH